MKLDKSKFKNRKNHQEKVADYLVDQHKKNEELRKKKIDISVFNMFSLNKK